jgi:hypothetical protein
VPESSLPPELLALPSAELVARLVAVLEVNTRLRGVVETQAAELETFKEQHAALEGRQVALMRRVQELERKAGKDSSNSGKPPSSDPVWDKKSAGKNTDRSIRERGVRSPGKQPGAMFFAVLAVAGQIERNYIREKTLEGQVIDDDSLTFALALKDKGVPVPDIAKKLTIKTGINAGKSPSVAFLYRALAEAEQAAADDGLPIRTKPVRIRRPDDPLTPEEADLRERLQAQFLQSSEDE